MTTPTQDMGQPPADDAALEQLVAELSTRVADGRLDIAAGLARAAYRRAPSTRLAGLDRETVAAQLAGALEFIDGRPQGTLALRVFNPDAQEHGWTCAGSVVEINVEDGPFLLSTVTEELSRLGLSVAEALHPIMGVVRDDVGRIARIRPARHATNRESFIHLELDRRLDEAGLAEVATNLRQVLDDARAATRDFPTMQRQVRTVAAQTRATATTRYDDDEVAEAAALLEWLLDDHFILLGYREYELVEVDGERAAQVVANSGLGVLATEASSTYAQPVRLSEVSEDLRARMEGGDLLVVSRTNRPSTVHRQVRMIYIGLKRVSDDGHIAGEHRFLGLFAQKAYAEPASTIPVLRRKLQRILELEDIVDHSYEERALRATFEAFPKHELFEADLEELRNTLVQLLETQRREAVRLVVRTDPQERSAAALVALPRERFNAEIRRRVQTLLSERFAAESVDYHLSMTERNQALLHFVLYPGPDGLRRPDRAQLEREVLTVTRTWDDQLRDALVARLGEVEGHRMADRWAERFPTAYRDTTAATSALEDVAELEHLDDRDGAVRMALHRRTADPPGRYRFKLYKVSTGVELSGFLPILESLGLTVVQEVPHQLARPGSVAHPDIHLHDFEVRESSGHPIDIEVDGPRLADAAVAIWEGRCEADSLNRLVLHAGLGWKDVAVFRAYRRYRRQAGTSFTEAYQNDALVQHADVARALTRLFAARFDPDVRDRGRDVDAARQAVLDALEEVERLDQDRILRGVLGLVDATLRTNRYRDRPWLALKLRSAQVPDIAKPVPHAEVFVYSPLLEGIHLRGGPVARGGIRWSDRLEDFRTEVLGLMKAQMVKNAVIVPTGSKGGFVLKRPPAEGGPEALRAAVRGQYESFIRGLLDVTDNVEDGNVVAPPGVRRSDGDDPYLVVAADRGTATFSDLANSISEEYGFWLGDAFASGGSRGYDHKAMGITARGVWIAVQRHFRELDIDVQAEPVTVIGIGDMSGDVFGNGMLQSRAIRLVAAFDHRHIFIDPEPDPETAFRERERLFGLDSSSWADYDRALISDGGGVWSRTAKSIPISDAVRQIVRTEEDALSPPELTRALLRAPVDLLFAGGIGTFVKSSVETNADVGDRANDAVRVNADEVAARVIGEGGNLAVTQHGRIQYARRGGRINTDAVDNSAGVDTSDHEVNLKILLDIGRKTGELADDERDRLLQAMQDDVAAAALRDVYLQTWAISQELSFSPGGIEAYEQLMVDLEEAGRLDRAVEVLPSTTELERRREAGAGLTRPELAVLLGYAKMDLRARLLRSDLPDQPQLGSALTQYFPDRVVQRLGHLLGRHRLRRELIATVVANDVVNRMGITYVSRTAHELGCMAYEVAAAYWIAREVADADRHWGSVEELDGRSDPALQLRLKTEVDRLVDAFTRAYLRQSSDLPAAPGASGPDIAAAVERDRPAFEQLAKVIGELGSPGRRATRQARIDAYTGLGIDPQRAEQLVHLSELVLVPDVAAVARDSGYSVRDVAEVFFHLSEALPLDRLHEHVQDLTPQGHWERWQHRGLVDELRQLRRLIATRTLAAHPDLLGEDAVRAFLAPRAPARERAESVVEMLEREEDRSLDAVAVAVRALRDVLGE